MVRFKTPLENEWAKTCPKKGQSDLGQGGPRLPEQPIPEAQVKKGTSTGISADRSIAT